MEDIKVKVGQMIREAREAKGLTLKELGTNIGSSKSVMSRYEKGKINASLDMLSKIATELDADFTVNIKIR